MKAGPRGTGRAFLAAALFLATPAAADPAAAPTRSPIVSAIADGKDRGAVAEALKDGGGDVAWGAIVIHHSGRAEGSAEAMDEYQRKVVRDPVGLAHHVVIGNGTGTPDGTVEVTGLWDRGVRTLHLFRRGDLPPAISVAWVGDGESVAPTAAQATALANVLAALADRFSIPVDRVLTHREVEGRSTACPGRHFRKLEVLAAADLMPAKPMRVRVEAASGRVSILAGDGVVQRFFRAPPRSTQPLPVGTWPVCRRDSGGAFGPTVVLQYPGIAEVDAAAEAGRLTPDETKRLKRALAAGECPPDDTALGGEIAFHAVTPGDEGTACVPLDRPDAEVVHGIAIPGTLVEIVP